MKIYLLTNEESRPRHIQVREGDIIDAELNPLTFDGVLGPGEGKHLFCHDIFCFARSKYVDITDDVFSGWDLLRNASANTVEKQLRRQYTANEIQELIRGFEARTLPEEQFIHDAHIIVASWYLFQNTGEEQFKIITEHIIAFKNATNTGNGKAFHTTLTRLWLLVVQEFLRVHKPETIETAVNAILKTELSDKSLPFQFYSRERLFSASAIESWMEPDVQSIDKLFQLVQSVKYIRD